MGEVGIDRSDERHNSDRRGDDGAVDRGGPGGRASADAHDDHPRGGIDVFDSLFVRQPIREGGTEAVRERLAAWADDAAGGSVRTLLPVAGATLATVFLDRGPLGGRRAGDPEGTGIRDALVWYVEVLDADAPAWDDPAAAVRSSPVFDRGLGGLLDGDRVHGSEVDGHRRVTHATNPQRRERYETAVGRSLVAPVAGDDLPIPVALIALGVRSGLRARLVDRGIGLGNRLKSIDAVDRRLRNRTDVLEAEAMYTESLLFDDGGKRPVVYYYMETESMEQLYEAFEASTGFEVRFSEWVFQRVFDDPARFLQPPIESDCEVLVHAVDPERP